jgi:integrase
MNDIIQFTQYDLDISAIDDALRSGRISQGTHRHYTAIVVLLIASNVNPFNRDELVSFANTLPYSGKANLKAALSIMLDKYVDEAKTSNQPVEKIQRFLWAVDVIKNTLKVKKQTTERTPHWLSQEQVNTITAAALANSTRDYIIMAMLLGAGLRREELENLTFDNIHQIPHKKTVWDVITLKGKGDKVRNIPIPPEIARHLREWQAVCKGGRVARRMHKGGKVGKSLSAYRIFKMVRDYGAIIGIPNLDPHDCRRSYGRLLYENTNNIVMVQQILGHESVKTTQIYVGLNINLDVPLDAFPVGGVQIAGD